MQTGSDLSKEVYQPARDHADAHTGHELTFATTGVWG